MITIKRGNKLSFEQLPEIKDTSDYVIDANFLELSEEPPIRIGSVDETTRRQCVRLIQEFDDCISSSIKDLGRTDAISMTLRCTSEVPIVYRPYRLAEPEKRALRGIVKDLLTNGIIQESSSPYASPVILVRKSNGEYRMCVDFRKLNAVTIKDKYPLPRIEDQIDKLGQIDTSRGWT